MVVSNMVTVQTKNGKTVFIARNQMGKLQEYDTEDFADSWHPAHPDDELPPRKPRSKAKAIQESE